jgi:peptidoglycan hydrolase-like protein with peptidoglycan-binding domain
VYLLYLGYHPGVTDGQWGQRTADALHQYQRAVQLPETDTVDDATFDKLTADAGALLAAKPPLQT